MYDKNNNKNNSALNQTDVTKSKKKETFIVLYERYLLDGNLDLLDKLFYAFFVSLHCAGRVIDITNSQLREKVKVSPNEFISIDKVKRSLKKLEDLDYIKRYTNKNNSDRIIIPVIKHDFDEIDESKAGVFYDRYGNEYHPVDKNAPRGNGAPRGKFAPPPVHGCTTYNIKENIKENNNYVITKENEFDEVIQKAQECLEKTKENLPNTSSEIVPYTYQETNLPVQKKSTTLQQLQEVNSLNLPSEFLEQLILTRKANKASTNKKAMQAVYQELIKLKDAGLDLNECLNMYANCGWKGFVADWFINSMAKKPSTHLDHNSIQWGKDMESDPFFQNLDWIK